MKIILLFSAALGGAGIYWLILKIRLKGFQEVADQIIRKAEEEAAKRQHESELNQKEKAFHEEKSREERWNQEKLKLMRAEEKIIRREEMLDEKLTVLTKKIHSLETDEKILEKTREQLKEQQELLEENHSALVKKLEKFSSLTAAEAKQLLLEQVSAEVATEHAYYLERTLKEARETAELKSKQILVTTIERLATATVASRTVKTLALPNDEIKGRIIGREGRNIRAFEKATGVTLVIDDTPRAAILSGFDPVRLHIAKLALQTMIEDGRVHPSRIEEAVADAEEAVDDEIINYGRDAALRIGAVGLHDELIKLLGKLKFRYSYGQNVLDHSLEVAHLMGLMAAELGLDLQLAKRIGLLHDIGKGVSHEREGSHAIIGQQLALEYGESQTIANGIGCHHKEMPAATLEASLCSIADTISASRPGARSDSVDEYIKRQKELEKIAYGFPGVQKAFALQAGREIRVFVFPDMIDDSGLPLLARDITKRIENHLNIKGPVKISITREKRWWNIFRSAVIALLKYIETKNL